MKCFLVKSYCLSLYGCPLWTLSSSLIETALNKLLRKLWNLPRNSHTSIVHSVARCHSVSNLAFKRFCSLYASALSSSSDLVRIDSSKLLYSFTGFNHIHGCYRDFSSVHELDIVFYQTNQVYIWFILSVRKLDHILIMLIIMRFVSIYFSSSLHLCWCV